ncbi:hypothetical protein ACIQTX_14670 [Microbacterium sp. NPDC090281]|uniref:hypothetical protein n=1 Tax=Microbacterium sp. NPDC090281 TaxID=3364208 RepID=UPI0037F7F1BC
MHHDSALGDARVERLVERGRHRLAARSAPSRTETTQPRFESGGNSRLCEGTGEAATGIAAERGAGGPATIVCVIREAEGSRITQTTAGRLEERTPRDV